MLLMYTYSYILLRISVENFKDCTRSLDDVSMRYKELQSQELGMCEQAKKRISELTEERDLYKKQARP